MYTIPTAGDLGEVNVNVSYTIHGEFGRRLNEAGGSLILAAMPHALLFVSATPDNEVEVTHIKLPCECSSVAVCNNVLALAMARKVTVYRNVGQQMAQDYPAQSNTYGSVYVPRTTYHTGDAQWHDLYLAGKRLVGVNSAFSCVAEVGYKFRSFEPLWKPNFISEILPEDRCHLNGACYVISKSDYNSRVRYVTALSSTDTKEGWRTAPENTGVLLDTFHNTVLRDDLSVPHCPRATNRLLYFLESGQGLVWKVDYLQKATQRYSRVAELPGFLHGLAVTDGMLFVGMARERVPRKRSPLPVALKHKELLCGVAACPLDTSRPRSCIEFTSGATEVYDVQFHPGPGKVGLMLDDCGTFNAIHTKDSSWWMKAQED